uniref:Uncharacterized protein n=1 Tax=Anguilla anguilla TaxID=7936 RepID=A0A0E9RSV7_ANGAN
MNVIPAPFVYMVIYCTDSLGHVNIAIVCLRRHL